MQEIPRLAVLGSQYSILTRAQVMDYLLARALQRQSGYVCVSNVHTTMMGFWDRDYQRITNESLLSVPDGMPLVWAMKLLGEHQQDRVRGPTLMRDFCAAGIKHGLKHYLLGGTAETLKLLRSRLEALYPGIQVVGLESPPFRELTEVENQAIWQRVTASQAQVLWVGLGAPKQELWMYKNRGPVLTLGVGAAFDLIAERIPEAPRILQSLGLEWVYRLLKEPQRLWRRYLWNNPAFLVLFLGQICTALVGRDYHIRGAK